MFEDTVSQGHNQTATNFTEVQRQETEPIMSQNKLSSTANKASMLVSPRQPPHQAHQSMFSNKSKTLKVAAPAGNDSVPTGFIQAYPSSKPPQSVASVNFSTMMEDSESLIRAYKKKKAELEQLRD